MLKYSGFTFIELLVVIAILGILLAVSLGWFTPNRIAVNQAAQGLASQFNRVRFEALRNNAYAGLRVDTSGNGAYSLWLDTNDNGVYNAGTDTVIQTNTLGTGDFSRVKRVASNTEANLTGFIFDSRGIPHAQSVGVVVISTLDDNFSKKVCVNSQGHADVIAASETCT